MFTACVSLFVLVALSPAQGVPPKRTAGAPRPLPAHVAIQDLGLAIFEDVYAAEGRWILFLASELQTGVDLNHDGDRLDFVLEEHDLASGVTRSLGMNGSPLQIRGDRALIGVSETGQTGDLNGDGDVDDGVCFAVDLASGTVRNSGLALWSGALDGDWAVLAIDEQHQGSDLSGDGDLDVAAFAWNLSGTASPLNLHRALTFPYIAIHQSFALLAVDEGAEHADLNGDGDTHDGVLEVYSGEAGTLLNTGLPIASPGSSVSFPSNLESLPMLTARGSRSAFLVQESGVDLNDDGTTAATDLVPHVFDASTGVLQNLRSSVAAPMFGLGAAGPQFPVAMKLTDEAVVFHVAEALQGQTDLNGDGDATDTSLFVHDLAAGTTTNLGVSTWDFTQANGMVAFQAWEQAQHVDWNGDGDTNDYVAQFYDLASGSIWNTGLPTQRIPTSRATVEPFGMLGKWVAFTVLEDGVDRNGDGDGDDTVLFFAKPSLHRLVNTRLAMTPDTAAISHSVFVANADGSVSVFVSEVDQGQDLDGDGSIHSTVLVVVRPQEQPVVVGAGITSLPAYGNAIPFLCDESVDGIDRTGDGDTADRVLRVARIRR